jgi:hypothetical protein
MTVDLSAGRTPPTELQDLHLEGVAAGKDMVQLAPNLYVSRRLLGPNADQIASDPALRRRMAAIFMSD